MVGTRTSRLLARTQDTQWRDHNWRKVMAAYSFKNLCGNHFWNILQSRRFFDSQISRTDMSQCPARYGEWRQTTSSHAHFPQSCQCRAHVSTFDFFTRTCVWLQTWVWCVAHLRALKSHPLSQHVSPTTPRHAWPISIILFHVTSVNTEFTAYDWNQETACAAPPGGLLFCYMAEPTSLAALTGSITIASCSLNCAFRVLNNVARARAPPPRPPTHVYFPMVIQVCHKVFRALIVCELALATGVCCWTLAHRQWCLAFQMHQNGRSCQLQLGVSLALRGRKSLLVLARCLCFLKARDGL